MHWLRFPADKLSRLSGKIKYLQNGIISESSAFMLSDNGEIMLYIPRALGAYELEVELFNEARTSVLFRLPAEWNGINGKFDLYTCTLNLSEIGTGLYMFRLRIGCGFGVVYGFKSEGRLLFSTNTQGKSIYQLSVSDFKYNAPTSKYGGVIYHVFVDRFCRGGESRPHGNEVVVDDWSLGVPEYPLYPGAPLKNNCFYGGTLWGVIDKLDYIASLGVNTIYLSPIFEAASNHKYDTGNYMKVDSMFGGDKALSQLIAEAKRRGIGIILDGVFNHTGSDSLYFNKEGNYNSIGAYQSTASPYYSWYNFNNYPKSYVCWWGIEILPRIHPDREDCRKYFVGDGGVIERYARMGIDGFRLDVADELSDEFIAQIKNKLDESNKSSVLYGEVWEDASNKIAYDKRKKYFLGCELDGVMNYPVRTGIIEYLRNKRTGELKYALTDIIYNAPKRIRDMQMNLLGTHDTVRILTVLGGESSAGRSNEFLSRKRMNEDERCRAVKLLKLAYTILSTLPGIPAIFYGDEAGLEGYHDPFNRMPYPWGHEDEELLSYYILLGKIRRKNTVYKQGDYELIELTPELLIFNRSDNKTDYLTVINNSEKNVPLEFEGKVKPLISKQSCIFDKQSGLYVIKPLTAEIFRRKKQ